MAETITMYHADLKETVEAKTEGQALVLEKSGWTRDIPKKREPKEEDVR